MTMEELENRTDDLNNRVNELEGRNVSYDSLCVSKAKKKVMVKRNGVRWFSVKEFVLQFLNNA